MARGTRSGGSPVSLFSLQDIITSLTGIMILLMLVLALKALTQAISEEDAVVHGKEEAAAALDELKQQMAELEQEVRDRSAIMSTEQASPLERVRMLQEARQAHEEAKTMAAQVEQDLRQAQQNRADTEEEVAKLRRELARQKTELLAAEAQAASAMEKPIAFIPAERLTKDPVILEVSGDGVRVVSRLPVAINMEWSYSDAPRMLTAALRQISSRQHYVVLIMKPSGVPLAMQLYSLAREQGFDAGYDVLEEEAALVLGG